LVDHPESEYEALFYALSRPLETGIANVAPILATNRFSLETFLLTNLDSRVKDTFRWERLEFPDYFALELGDILEAGQELDGKTGPMMLGNGKPILFCIFLM
jgi:Cdc6-like AAA superfamily ATPase